MHDFNAEDILLIVYYFVLIVAVLAYLPQRDKSAVTVPASPAGNRRWWQRLCHDRRWWIVLEVAIIGFAFLFPPAIVVLHIPIVVQSVFFNELITTGAAVSAVSFIRRRRSSKPSS